MSIRGSIVRRGRALRCRAMAGTPPSGAVAAAAARAVARGWVAHCPECGARTVPAGGCCYCPACGWSACG